MHFLSRFTLLLLFLTESSFLLSAQTVTELPHNESPQSENTSLNEKDIPTAKHSLAADFVEMMNILRQESPVVYERINDMPREVALQKIMTALDTGVIWEKQLNRQEAEMNVLPEKSKKEIFNCLRLTGKKIPYFRIDELSWEQAFQIVREATVIMPEKPEGLILDMREAANGDYYSAVYLANTLADTKTRIVVLMSSQTGGMPSLLPSVLKQKKARISILGMPSYTPIFPSRAIRFSGNIWKFPLIADEFKDISPYPLIPDLKRTAMPRVDFLQLKSHPNELGLDPLLRLATDLLVLNSAMKL